MDSDTKKIPRIIVHDVCQCANFTHYQKRTRINDTNIEELFYKNMVDYSDVPMELAVMANGIERYPKTVDFIKNRPAWTVCSHGFRHVRYDCLPENVCREEMARAKRIIEDAFGITVRTYIPPFNGYNEMTRGICSDLEMDEIRVYRKLSSYIDDLSKCNQFDYHYWDTRNVDSMRTLFKNINMKPPVFIIGAPRSGTTALMYHMARQMPDYLPLKEHEQFWIKNGKKSAGRIKGYYCKLMVNHGKDGVIDKNVRNSMRILVLNKFFPDARFIHIIRDGRAVINSWKQWAITRRKEVVTVEESAKQWVEYVTYIRNNSSKINNYEEVRYEDLCREHDYFSSRNNKWKKNITKEQLDTIMQTAGPLLKELNYV